MNNYILKPNATLGIIAPASPDDKTFINNKINEFSSLGFNVKLGNHLFDKCGFLAGSDKDRATDLMNMFLDTDIDGIICFRGGYGSIRILPYLDINLIENNKKFFCGYSDITILLNYFAKHNIISFHGPMVNSNFKNKATLENFLNLCKFSLNNYSLNLFNDNLRIYNKNNFFGKIVGGNLSIICSSIGTPYEINTKDSILLIEEVNEAPYAIDRMLTQLYLNNKLSCCNGIILGHMKGCFSNYSSLERIILDKLVPLNIPIISNAHFGHDYPNLTIPIGAIGYFNISNYTLTFK